MGELLLESFRHQEARCTVLTVVRTGIHALLQIAADPRVVVGRAKAHVTFELASIAGAQARRRRPIWEIRSLPKPIRSRAHQVTTYRYFAAHRARGAWVWWEHPA